MPKQVHVRPADGLKIRIPNSDPGRRLHEFMPPEGLTVTLSAGDNFWQRRIDQGDVLVGKPKSAAAKKES